MNYACMAAGADRAYIGAGGIPLKLRFPPIKLVDFLGFLSLSGNPLSGPGQDMEIMRECRGYGVTTIRGFLDKP